MDNHKHTCRCGKRVDKLVSYFVNEIRVTVCDACAEQFKLKEKTDVIVDYDKIKNSDKTENFYHMIDTREK